MRAYLPATDRASRRGRRRASVRPDLGHLQAFGLRPIGELQTREIHEADWANAWKRHFPVLRLGRRLVIRPTWRRHRPVGDEVVIALDPGMAFGTGLHPTTRLCLVGLERLADAGRLAGATVVDVGCGSGILAVTAARFGAARVLGLDIDPIAVEATHGQRAAQPGRAPRPGASRARCRPRADPSTSSWPTSSRASSSAWPPRSTRRRHPGGRLLASGIYVDREPEVRRALAAVGFHVTGRDTEGDWVALQAERVD